MSRRGDAPRRAAAGVCWSAASSTRVMAQILLDGRAIAARERLRCGPGDDDDDDDETPIGDPDDDEDYSDDDDDDDDADTLWTMRVRAHAWRAADDRAHASERVVTIG